jgi:hypothetical protein
MRIIHLIVLIVAVASAIVLGSALGVSWVSWRIIDTLTIASGGAEFFVIAGDAARVFPSNQLPYKRRYAFNWLDGNRDWFEKLPAMIGLIFSGVKDSPSGVNEIQRQHDLVRPWAHEVSKQILGLNPDNLPELTTGTLVPFPADVTDPYILHIRDETYDLVETYTKLRTEALKSARKLEKTDLEVLSILASPFLVAVAIGTALFKALYGPQ